MSESPSWFLKRKSELRKDRPQVAKVEIIIIEYRDLVKIVQNLWLADFGSILRSDPMENSE